MSVYKRGRRAQREAIRLQSFPGRISDPVPRTGLHPLVFGQRHLPAVLHQHRPDRFVSGHVLRLPRRPSWLEVACFVSGAGADDLRRGAPDHGLVFLLGRARHRCRRPGLAAGGVFRRRIPQSRSGAIRRADRSDRRAVFRSHHADVRRDWGKPSAGPSMLIPIAWSAIPSTSAEAWQASSDSRCCRSRRRRPQSGLRSVAPESSICFARKNPCHWRVC